MSDEKPLTLEEWKEIAVTERELHEEIEQENEALRREVERLTDAVARVIFTDLEKYQALVETCERLPHPDHMVDPRDRTDAVLGIIAALDDLKKGSEKP